MGWKRGRIIMAFSVGADVVRAYTGYQHRDTVCTVITNLSARTSQLKNQHRMIGGRHF